MLTLKNVHALRTLFNVAHRLHGLLGPSWVLVLDNLNALDRILNSPRTTTQARELPGQPFPAVGATRGGLPTPPSSPALVSGIASHLSHQRCNWAGCKILHEKAVISSACSCRGSG